MDFALIWNRNMRIMTISPACGAGAVWKLVRTVIPSIRLVRIRTVAEVGIWALSQSAFLKEPLGSIFARSGHPVFAQMASGIKVKSHCTCAL